MRKIALVIAMLLPQLAQAQTAPDWYQGYTPSTAEWLAVFAGKQDTLGYTALNRAGDTMQGNLNLSGAAPALTSCGTAPPAVTGNNEAGVITMGTGSPTGCTLTFNVANPFVVTPTCVVTWQANLAAMGYTNTQTALTLTQTGTSSNKVNYRCAATP